MIFYIIIFIILSIIIKNYILNINGYILSKYINKINKPYCNSKETFITSNDKFFQTLRDNWTIIRDEYINYNQIYKKEIYSAKDIIPMNAYLDKGDIPWENIILRVYNKDTVLIKYFPETYKLIKDNCSFAMFSILPPGKHLLPHYGPYNGILRYHLGLIIPKDKNNCFIMCNNNKYIWSEGKDMLFDDTIEHYVKNDTDETRVILFLDIPRQFDNIFINMLNKTFLYCIKFNTTIDTIVENANKFDEK